MVATQAVEATAATPLELNLKLAELRALMATVPLGTYASQSPADARRNVALLRELRSVLEVHIGVAVRAVERLVPARDVGQLLASDFGRDATAAHRDLKNAHSVAGAHLAEQSAARGAISHAHAVVIGRALRDLPQTATESQRRAAEQTLIGDAAVLTPKDLEIRARRITEVFQPEPEVVDATEDALLRKRETAARQRTSLAMWSNFDGTWSGKFTLPELQARMLKTVVDAHAAPRRIHLTTPEAADPQTSMADHDMGSQDPGDAAAVEQDSSLSRVQQVRISVTSDMPYDRKAGEALIAIIEHLPVDRLPTTGGTPARIMVTIDEQKLRSTVAAATLATGERISASELRRLACTHGILPAVFGGSSVPIDLGRTQRLFSTYQRDALAIMDGGCVAPGCDRPPAWCETHHGSEAWVEGGRTDLRDGYLLCSTHHHEAHQKRWALRREPDGAAEINRGQDWERNHRYRP